MLGSASEGNIKTSTASRKLQKMFYCFTFFYKDEDEILGLANSLKGFCKKYFYGKEVCPTTGKLHLQGFMSLKRKMRFSEVKRLVPSSLAFYACKGNEKDNFQYCSKENDFYEWERPIELKYDVTQVERDLLNDIAKSNDRIVHISNQSDNFMMNLYSTYSCGFFVVKDISSLSHLSRMKNMMVLLSFSYTVSEDEQFGILGIISRGHYQGHIFGGKYIVMN